MIILVISRSLERKEGNDLFNDALNTFYLQLYGIRHMVKDHSDSEREETCCLHMGYSFRLTARVLLYASSHRQYNTYHGLCYTSRGALDTYTSAYVCVCVCVCVWHFFCYNQTYKNVYWLLYHCDNLNLFNMISGDIKTSVDGYQRRAYVVTLLTLIRIQGKLNFISSLLCSMYINRLHYLNAIRMNEWIFNDTPARKADRLLGVRKR